MRFRHGKDGEFNTVFEIYRMIASGTWEPVNMIQTFADDVEV
tara:strand:+ start:1111 stop:1236 length:126 start_codon:yes stop_codon:yes gene_type:complete